MSDGKRCHMMSLEYQYISISNFISYDIIWCHLMSSDVIWCHLMSSYVIFCHLMSYDEIWCHLVSSDVIWCHLMSSVVICCHLMSLLQDLTILKLFGEYIYRYIDIFIKKFQTSNIHISLHWMYQGDKRWQQMTTYDHRWQQMTKDDNRWQ